MSKNYWLIKSEGNCYSIGYLARDKKTAWTGIRNFQARNFMRDGMQVGDGVLFYHSGGAPKEPSGVYGIAKVASAPHVDQTAFDTKDEHFDVRAAAYSERAKKESGGLKTDLKKELWVCVDIAFVRKLARPISLEEIKEDIELRKMLVARRGQRLSVMPVKENHFTMIDELGK